MDVEVDGVGKRRGRGRRGGERWGTGLGREDGGERDGRRMGRGWGGKMEGSETGGAWVGRRAGTGLWKEMHAK